MNNTKKIRILYDANVIDEKQTLIPSISFNDGFTWVSASKIVNRLKNAPIPRGQYKFLETSTDNSITDIGNDWKRLDISFFPTISEIPYIVNHTITPCKDRFKDKGFSSGTYYFSVASDTFYIPNMDDVSNERYVKYHSKPSKVYKVVIPETDLEETFAINFFLSYSVNISGLLLYCTKEDGSGSWESMMLRYITNAKTVIHKKMPYSEGEDDILYGKDEIWLENGAIFPNSGIVRIGNEYISYDDKIYEKLNNGSRIYKLIGLQRGIRNTDNREIHKIGEYVHLSDFEEGMLKGALPVLQHPMKFDYNTTRLIQSLIFSSNSNKFDNNIMNNVYESKPREIGNIGSIMQTLETNYYKGKGIQLNGHSCVDLDLNYLSDATISFSMKITSSTLSSSNEIMGIFGHDRTLWMKINKNTRKPYIGIGDKIIADYNDSRIPSLIRNEWVNIILSYSMKGKHFNLKYLINGNLILNFDEELETEDNPIDITLCKPYFGGLNTSSEDPELFFIGQLDEYKYFDYDMSEKETKEYYSKSLLEHQRFMGLITIMDKIHNIYRYTEVTFEDNEDVIKNDYINKDDVIFIGRDLNIVYNVGLIKAETINDKIHFYDKIIVYLDGRRLIRKDPWHDIYDYEVDIENNTLVFNSKIQCYSTSKMLIIAGDANQYDPKYDLVVNAINNGLYKKKISPNITSSEIPIIINDDEQCFINAVNANEGLFVYGKVIYNTGELLDDLSFRQLTKTIKLILDIDYTLKKVNNDTNKFIIELKNPDLINMINKPLINAFDSKLYQLEIYATDQDDIYTELNEWLSNEGYIADYQNVPYPVEFDTIKLKFDMHTENTINSPKLKNLSVIISKFTFED